MGELSSGKEKVEGRMQERDVVGIIDELQGKKCTWHRRNEKAFLQNSEPTR
jgi:hypothetical protein